MEAFCGIHRSGRGDRHCQQLETLKKPYLLAGRSRRLGSPCDRGSRGSRSKWEIHSWLDSRMRLVVDGGGHVDEGI